jgi:uncharacterized membrane protein
MTKLNDELLQFEEEYEKIKSKNEKFLLIYILVYFLLILFLVYTQQKYYQDNFLIKIAFFSFILLGFVIYHLMRNYIHKSKKRQRKFFGYVIEKLKTKINKKENLENLILVVAKETFNSRNITFSKFELEKYSFWDLLLINLNIKINE